MRALSVPAPGQPPEISDLPAPSVADGTVLVKVRAAGFNALDNALAVGVMSEVMPHQYPLVLGRDAAGVVEAVGEGVDHVKPGDEVFGHILLVPPIQAGTVAEYAVLPAAAVAAKPSAVDFVTAAALPLAGAAALGAVDGIDPQPGQTVLVIGAGGGVGSYAVQLIAARGATVIATAAADDADRLKALGAATVVDYTTGSVADQVRAARPDGIDAIIDLVSYAADSLPLDLLVKGGKVASTLGAADEQTLAALGLTGTNVMAAPTREVIAPLAQQVADGTLTVDVTTTLPLARAAEGLATLASGAARGKIVVTFDN
ncbi:NADP-dependent oxidoreductase [Streptomyces fulvoviolaceus]|uniref:NADP-dependent oxidoreductase n=1 Tax=Streptomyces fulvoviolaceus TaxID=285535 RepID=UPI0021BE244A|nr:NADP-dependent oxidoreductase [Streptomyces fulvoviolaceus]MCT9080300.1 NADP-dependent oxidoreductase [Streptomyces fulvoviolaceus]